MGATNGQGGGWSLEVVRGKDAGKTFALAPGEVVLGNAPGDRAAIDLADQEAPASPRRMAGRHASLVVSTRGLAVRDLESPGGTFVNRQRVLPGLAKPLQTGDVIQLGGVQLRVVNARVATAPPARPTPAATAPSGPLLYAIPGGPTCRSWDDFLTASAQKWEAMRDELTSGRLAAYLGSVGRAGLAPSPDAPGSPDERLDAWLGSLPSTREARPELDVHPARLVIRAVPGGGTIRKTVHVSNVGFRLLRSTARVEPAGTGWLSIPPDFAGRAFATVEGTDVPVNVAIPETLPQPLKAELVIEGNGDSRRVAVVLEAKPSQAEFAPEGPPTAGGSTLGDLIGRQSLAARVATWGLAFLALRLVIGVASGSIGEDAMTASGPDVPRLAGVAAILAAAGALLGGWLASRRGGPRDVPAGAFAGGCFGVVAASALVATCRAVEPVLGGWSNSVIAVCVLWSVLGAGLAALSILFVKGKP